MSSTLYPLGIIDKQKVTPTNSVISDAFENGTTMTRLLWNAQNFKRKFELTHSSLTLAEWRYLRSFYSQRSGTYDAFWYRDNVNRRGNANVRFSATLAEDHDGVLYNAQVTMDELAPIRALPELDELIAAAGSAPVLWYDANREFYLNHAGTIITEPAVYDSASQNYPATWQTGSLSLGGVTAQYQAYDLTGTNWAKTTGNIAQITGTQPDCTLFVVHSYDGFASPPVSLLFGLGTIGTNSAMGLQWDTTTGFRPWIGTAGSWSNAVLPYTAATRSLALVWTAGTNNVSLFNNAAFVGTDTVTRSYATGPFSLGAAPDGSLPSVNGNHLAHILVFSTALTPTQIRALHNLLGYQYGLSIVP